MDTVWIPFFLNQWKFITENGNSFSGAHIVCNVHAFIHAKLNSNRNASFETLGPQSNWNLVSGVFVVWTQVWIIISYHLKVDIIFFSYHNSHVCHTISILSKNYYIIWLASKVYEHLKKVFEWIDWVFHIIRNTSFHKLRMDVILSNVQAKIPLYNVIYGMLPRNNSL